MLLLEMESRLQTYQQILSGFINEFVNNANDVNTLIHDIEQEGKINLNIWSFNKASAAICRQVYHSLSLKYDDKQYGVCYVRLIEEGTEDSIMMTGFANLNTTSPSIYNRKRTYKGSKEDPYYDAKLFRLNSSDISILMTKEDIRREFDLSSETADKYSQYIGVPVVCNGSKMVGLLEIVCFEDYVFSKEEAEIEELVNKYVMPYASFLFLLHKLEKAILAQPKRKSRREKKRKKN